MFTGIHTGAVMVTTIAARAAPPPELEGWEDVDEVSVVVQRDHTLAVEPDAVPPAPSMALTDGSVGAHRLRIHAFGRDVQRDGVSSVPVERYLLVCWPQALEPARTLAGRSTVYADRLSGAEDFERRADGLAQRYHASRGGLEAAKRANLEAAMRRQQDDT